MKEKKLFRIIGILKFTEKEINQKIENLNKLGIKKEEIIKNPQLLSIKTENIKQKIKTLVEMGIELRDILKNTKVLLWNKKTIKERYKQLQKIGVRKKDLNKQLVFLFCNINNIKARIKYLKNIGLSEKQIFSYPNILLYKIERLKSSVEILEKLGIDKKTPNYAKLIEKNKKNLIKNYMEMRNYFTKEEIVEKYKILLTTSPLTIRQNIEFFYNFHLPIERIEPIVLGRKKINSIKKINQIAKFYYPKEYTEDKKTALLKTFEKIRKTPYLLIRKL